MIAVVFQSLLHIAAGTSIVIATQQLPAHLEEIRQAYEDQIKSIETIECVSTLRHSSSPTVTTIRDWARDGKKFRHVEHGRSGQRDIGLLHDGHLYFNLAIRDGKNENVQMMDTLADIFEFNILPEVMFGTDILTTRKTLSDLLADKESRLVGNCQIDGTDCCEIESGPFKASEGGKTNRCRLFLSRQHDYLPKRIVVYNDGVEFSKLAAPSWFIDMEIVEFKTFHDERADADRSLPAKAIFRQSIPNEMTLEVTSCTVNRTFGENHFRLSLPDGVQILDVTGKR